MQGDGGGHGWRIRSGLVQDSSRLQVLLESHSVLEKASIEVRNLPGRFTPRISTATGLSHWRHRVTGDLSRKAVCCLPFPEAGLNPVRTQMLLAAGTWVQPHPEPGCC